MTGRTPETSALVHYLHVLRRGVWIVVLCTFLLGAAATYLSARQAKQYESSADVFLSNQDLSASLTNIQTPYVDPVREAEDQAILAGTPAVARRAVALAHIPGLTAADAAGSVSISPDPTSDLMTFTAVGAEPRRAAILATAYARAYIAYRHQVDTAALVQAETQVEQRMQQLEADGGKSSPVYADLSSKDQQLKTLQVLQGSNAFLARAAGGATQIQPKPKRNGVLGAVLGFMLGIGLVFVLDAMNTRVRNPAEVEQRLGLPLLGRLPEPARKLRRRGALALIDEPNAPAADAYRVLATNLEFVNLDRGAKTIMFSSATRDEGKSTTVANLAVALARMGRRVVLVDLDLRLPTIREFFEIRQDDGLTTVALGYTRLDDALVRIPLRSEAELEFIPSVGGSPSGSLEVLTTGPLPPNPAEFAASSSIQDIFGQLIERADVVLVDAAPLLQASESVALTAKVEGLVVVTKLTTMRRSMLNELHRTLEGLPVITLGVVATGAATDDTYGYGYGYGYGSYQANGASARATNDRVAEQGLR